MVCRLLVYFAVFIENNQSDTMTDFNTIRYHAVIEFLTLENILPQQIHKNRMTVVYGEDVPSYATVTVFHLDICCMGGWEFPSPEMTISPRRRRPEIFFNFSSRLQTYERNRTGTLRSDFCLQISACRFV